jgi:hypothetical protein
MSLKDRKLGDKECLVISVFSDVSHILVLLAFCFHAGYIPPKHQLVSNGLHSITELQKSRTAGYAG